MTRRSAYFTRILITVLIMALCSAPALARRGTLICESHHDRHQYCRAETHNNVHLKRQLSHTACREGRSWGYDRRGIWVDRGCRAEFEYGEHTGSDSGKEAAIAGAVVGAAVIAGVIAAAAARRNQSQAGVPNWAVGTFRGYNPRYSADVELRIYEDGNVQGKILGTGLLLEGYYRNNSIFFETTEFTVQQQGSGLWLTQVDNRSNNVAYHRVS